MPVADNLRDMPGRVGGSDSAKCFRGRQGFQKGEPGAGSRCVSSGILQDPASEAGLGVEMSIDGSKQLNTFQELVHV